MRIFYKYIRVHSKNRENQLGHPELVSGSIDFIGVIDAEMNSA
jgi:hypothetical protein